MGDIISVEQEKKGAERAWCKQEDATQEREIIERKFEQLGSSDFGAVNKCSSARLLLAGKGRKGAGETGEGERRPNGGQESQIHSPVQFWTAILAHI